MKILVTGGAGFIGSHVVDAYITAGHDVVIVDNLSTGKKGNLNSRAKFYHEDLRSVDSIAAIFKKEKPEIVNHLAAQKSVQKSIENPLEDVDTNILGLLPLLENSIKYAIKKFIFTSTGGAIYGNTVNIPTAESQPPDIMSPYALTKYMGEQYTQLFHKLYSLPFTILRPSNIYGPRQISEGQNGVIALFFENILNGKSSTIYNSQDMKKGATRDYLYVKDLVQANILALTKGDNEICNIGSGKEICTADLYTQISQITGKKFPLKQKTMRKSEVLRSALDYKKAAVLLNWHPTTSLIDGLTKTYQSYL